MMTSRKFLHSLSRSVGMGSCAVWTMYGVILLGWKVFLYFTTWSLLIGLAAFSSLVLKRYQRFFKELSVNFPSVAWIFSVSSSIFYCTVLFPTSENLDQLHYMLPAHVITSAFLTIDMFTNQARIKQVHARHAISVALVYFLMLNLPYSLTRHHIYELINYTNASSYALILYFFLLFVIVEEIGRCVKEKILYRWKAADYLPLVGF